LLYALDAFFLVFHTLLVAFNVLGWAWKATRRWNLLTLGLTAGSWLVIGLWHGRIGYCVCTDWHWQVRRQLGYHDKSDTYIQWMVERTTGIVPDLAATQIVSGVVFVLAVALSVTLNWRDFSRRRAT
jgi:hypothetical protein